MLPRRVGAYSPAWLDQLTASGELVWVGAGASGRSSGRVALYFREDAAAIGPPAVKGPAPEPPGEPVHEALRERLGASPCFFTDLLAELPAFAPEELQDGLWDLVWAGEATNDAFAPLRAPRLTLARAQREQERRARPGRRFGARRGGAQATVQGRWSLAGRLFDGDGDPRQRRRVLAELLLERYGIVTREQVLAESVTGGFSALYDSLSDLETLGVCRRGYFVEGLGGAQFALPGAVERLRAQPDPALGAQRGAETPAPLVLAATDPAQPYGAALRWPEPRTQDAGASARRPQRVAGAYVVLVGRRAGALRRARRPRAGDARRARLTSGSRRR